MVKMYYVRVSGGRGCPVAVSDEPWKGDVEVTGFDALTPLLLIRAAERKFGIPWCIAETPRLLVRELQTGDLSALQAMDENPGGNEFCGPAEEHFSDAGFLDAYIRNQYGFYGFGIWGIVRKENGQLIGKAGLSVPTAEEWSAGPIREERAVRTAEPIRKADTGQTAEPIRKADTGQTAEPVQGVGEYLTEKTADADAGAGEPASGSADSDVLELSYQIAEPYRRQGYAFEACKAILRYGMDELGISRYLVRIRKGNVPSVRLAEKLTEELKTPLPQTERRFQVCISYYP